MKVVIVSFYYDEKVKSEEALLQQHYTTTGWAEALQRRGIEVIVINRFFKDSELVKNNVCYLFVKDSLGGTFSAWQIPYQFLKKISALNADIVHLHHLTLSPQTFFLRLLLNKKTAIVIQHHGGRSPGTIKRSVHNVILLVADAFFFTTIEQGKEWFMGKKQYRKVLPVMEGATFFNYESRDKERVNDFYNRCEARKKTGMHGSPVFLWVGRLDINKDPLTVLNGFEMILNDLREATLYMIYSDDLLTSDVKKKYETNSMLRSHVFFLGRIPHEQIEMYYHSADYFVSASHYEGSGYALSEALRCGCVPVVTDIPAFTMMTDNGKLGCLWQAGNAGSFALAVKKVVSKPLNEEGKACVEFYTDSLSFDAIAGKAINHYQTVINRRRKTAFVLQDA